MVISVGILVGILVVILVVILVGILVGIFDDIVVKSEGVVAANPDSVRGLWLGLGEASFCTARIPSGMNKSLG